MDKYQKYLLDKVGGIKYLITALFVEQDENCKNNYISFNEENGAFILTQDDNINKTKYVLIISGCKNRQEIISNAYVYIDDKRLPEE